MSIAENIKKLRMDNDLSQVDLGKIAGVTDKAVSTWEAGTKTPRMGAIEKMSIYFGVPKSAILDDAPIALPIPSGFEPLPEMVQVPLIGTIACGSPILAEENIQEYIGVPAVWRADFALKCKGDSMAPTIKDGDIVCIRKQQRVESGEIAAVRIGDEATLKHYHQQGNIVTLVADNAAVCPPMVYMDQQLEEIAIEGKAVGLCRGL